MKPIPSFYYQNRSDITPDDLPGKSDCLNYRISDPAVPARIFLKMDPAYGGTILIEDMTRHDLSPEELQEFSSLWAKSGNMFLCPLFATAFFRGETVYLSPGTYYAFDVEGYVSLIAETDLPDGRVE